MNTVIPISNDRIAGHFTKAESFLFLDAKGQKINSPTNPAFNNHDCSAKKMIIELFKAANVQRVIVRNIGQRSLGKLLANNMHVFKSDVNYVDYSVLLDDTHSYITALTKAEEGRPSLNHQEKGDECGCHDHDKVTNSQAVSPAPGNRQRCCEKSGHKAHKHNKASGRGRCCH